MKKLATSIFLISLFMGVMNYVVEKEKYKQYRLESRSSEVFTYKININLANIHEFENLPGIGPSLAKEIIDFRRELGGFKDVDDLLSVRGIGERKFEAIREYLTMEII